VHPVSGKAMNNMYEAQTLWDEYMADTAAKYLTKRGGKMVLLAGSRHIESRDGTLLMLFIYAYICSYYRLQCCLYCNFRT
jgi:uncharacterized iron-regulated protein